MSEVCACPGQQWLTSAAIDFEADKCHMNLLSEVQEVQSIDS